MFFRKKVGQKSHFCPQAPMSTGAGPRVPEPGSPGPRARSFATDGHRPRWRSARGDQACVARREMGNEGPRGPISRVPGIFPCDPDPPLLTPIEVDGHRLRNFGPGDPGTRARGPGDRLRSTLGTGDKTGISPPTFFSSQNTKSGLTATFCRFFKNTEF